MDRFSQRAKDQSGDLVDEQHEHLPVFELYVSRARRLLRASYRRLLHRKLRSKEDIRHFYDSEFLSDISFMNYGYATEEDAPLPDNDRSEYFSYQLYKQVVDGVDLTGQRVLEVSCGHGAGANYLTRLFQIGSLTALDYSIGGIHIARDKYGANPALRFSLGDAELLPFADNTFDVVVNIEAATCYNSRKQFFSEVQRVLKSGGWFLYCDILFVPYDPSGDLVNSNLAIQHQRDITNNVIRSLDLDSKRREALIKRHVGKADDRWFKAWAGVKGYGVHKGLVEGKRSYILIRAKKLAELGLAQ